MSHIQGPSHGHDPRQKHIQIKIHRLEEEQRDSEELESEAAFEPSFEVGTPAATQPRHEDEQILGELDEVDEGTPPTFADDGDEPQIGRTWAKQALLRSRAPVVVVRLRVLGEYAEPVPTLAPAQKSRPMLDNLCDFLRDRFGPAARKAIPNPDEWAKLLGSSSARPTERLALLARLTVTGAHEFERPGGGRSDGNDLGLGHYLYKFAALPDGTAFSVRLLLAGGKSRGKKSGSEGDDPLEFDRLPLGVRLLALGAALQMERKGMEIQDDQDFGKMLRTEAARLLGGASVPAITRDAVRRFRDWLKKSGHGNLFPKASERKRAAHGSKA